MAAIAANSRKIAANKNGLMVSEPANRARISTPTGVKDRPERKAQLTEKNNAPVR
jgi:hypothetical protein